VETWIVTFFSPQYRLCRSYATGGAALLFSFES